MLHRPVELAAFIRHWAQPGDGFLPYVSEVTGKLFLLAASRLGLFRSAAPKATTLAKRRTMSRSAKSNPRSENTQAPPGTHALRGSSAVACPSLPIDAGSGWT